jgi:LDH2 family malate/lactate/ureidoglycolate dehydrogenase
MEASLMGVDTHGINLLPTYLKELEHGRATTAPHFGLDSRAAGTCTLDGDNALGPVVGQHAAREAIARAREVGVATVAVSRSNHLGASGVHARTIAAADQIGLVLTNSDALVAPANGCEPLCGTNPIACAAPGVGDDGFFFDMATSVVAFTRVRNASKNGTLQPGWAVDTMGADLALGGPFSALLPLGGYKGQGLGMLVQILCALLTGMPFDADLQNMFVEPFNQPRNISHCFIAIDIASFIPPATFRARLTELLNRFRQSRSVEGQTVRVPGDLESIARAERTVLGVPVDDTLHALLTPYLQAESAA